MSAITQARENVDLAQRFLEDPVTPENLKRAVSALESAISGTQEAQRHIATTVFCNLEPSTKQLSLAPAA